MSLINNEVAEGDTQSQHFAEGDTDFSPDDVVAMWRYVGNSNVQCHLKGALRALNTLIHLSQKEGPYRHFRHALQSNDARANHVALVLILSQLRIIEGLMGKAEEEHEEYLRTELLAYSQRIKGTPQ